MLGLQGISGKAVEALGVMGGGNRGGTSGTLRVNGDGDMEGDVAGSGIRGNKEGWGAAWGEVGGEGMMETGGGPMGDAAPQVFRGGAVGAADG